MLKGTGLRGASQGLPPPAPGQPVGAQEKGGLKQSPGHTGQAQPGSWLWRCPRSALLARGPSACGCEAARCRRRGNRSPGRSGSSTRAAAARRRVHSGDPLPTRGSPQAAAQTRPESRELATEKSGSLKPQVRANLGLQEALPSPHCCSAAPGLQSGAAPGASALGSALRRDGCAGREGRRAGALSFCHLPLLPRSSVLGLEKGSLQGWGVGRGHQRCLGRGSLPRAK